jgi:hypothetical protein
MDQAAEPVPPQNPDILAYSGRTLPLGGRALAERPVRAMNVIVLDVLTQDQPKVPPVISIRSRHSRRALEIHRSAIRSPGAPG